MNEYLLTYEKFSSFIVSIIYIINFITIVTILFLEKKDPSRSFMWIIVISIMPIIGFFAYLFFGRGFKVSLQKKLKLKKILEKKYSIPENNNNMYPVNNIGTFEFNDKSAENNIQLINMFYNINNSVFTQNNTVKVFPSAQDKFKYLIEDIKNAKESINLVYFIVKNDNIGNEIIDLLCKKAKEGVTVRLIYDEIGCFFTPKKLFNRLIKAGGHVTKFSPVRFEAILHANYRNHRKIVVIDNHIGYLGGINIGDEYLGLKKKVSPWRDTHVRIKGLAVSTLQLRFFIDWVYATSTEDKLDSYLKTINFNNINNNGTTGIQIVSSGPDMDKGSIKLGINKMILNAKKSIYIHTPYLIPDDSMLDALQIASNSGVEIYVIIPGKPDKKIVYHVTYSYVQQLLNYNIKVYKYNGFLHSKMIIVDDEIVTIGTTNFDIRSFDLHFEINAFIYDSKIAKECIEQFFKDISSSERITNEIYDSRGLMNKFLEGIFSLFAPLM